MYRHALPPGFVLKKDKKKEEKEEEISLEELIENEVRMDGVMQSHKGKQLLQSNSDIFGCLGFIRAAKAA